MVNYSQFGTKEMEMTNYDIFMMNKNKKKAESKLFDRRNEKAVDISYENYKKKFTQERDEEYSENYKHYLMEQLERKSPKKILTEEEYYGEVQRKPSKQSFHKSETTRKVKSQKINKTPIMSNFLKKLFGNVEIKKGGKIFIAFYVLIVIAVASILIVMNTTASNNFNSADAVGREMTTSETVQPMVIEKEDSSNQNWFDKLCDSLNK